MKDVLEVKSDQATGFPSFYVEENGKPILGPFRSRQAAETAKDQEIIRREAAAYKKPIPDRLGPCPVCKHGNCREDWTCPY